jgi:shikimate dehydrogenase
VNTIVNDGGHLVGHNTDIPALVDEIAALRSRPRSALVLGAGGAARAVAAALTSLGCPSVTLASRSGSGDAGAAVDWTAVPEAVGAADLLVNATPIGTASDETPIGSEWLHDDLAVLDLVYRPSPTRLVRDARARGLRARAGAGVLLGQGSRSLELWLRVAAPRSVMAAALRMELGDAVDV